MRRLLPWILLPLLVACGATDEQVTPTMPALPTVTPLPSAPTTADQAQDAAYPAPTTTVEEPGYPAPRATPTLSSAYQALDPIWMQKAVGKQCQSYDVNLGQAELDLTQAGVRVLDAQMALLPVCEACDICASSEHYRVLVPTEDVPTAKDLGWAEAE